MANVNYVYQWIVVDGGTETDIDGATASTYRLVAADQGKTITVRVSFADDVGTAQTLTSAATGTIQPSAATPAVTGVTVSSTPLRTSAGATSPDTFGMREHIEFTVQFHRAVTVIGTPTFTFMLVNSTRQATYYAGSGTDTLRFSYAVSGGSSDVDADGISWQANAIALNGGTITRPDLTSTAATLEHDAAGNQPEHKVDGRIGVTLTTVVRVEPASTPELRSDTYPPGEVIRIAVTVSEAVTVVGDPQFRFSLGRPGESPESSRRFAAYDAASSTATKLVFSYPVLATDEAPNGISIGDHRTTWDLDANDLSSTSATKVDIDFTHTAINTQRTTR